MSTFWNVSYGPGLECTNTKTLKETKTTETLRIFLRVVHILSGISWVGGACFVTLFLEPTVRRAGTAGGRFMDQMISHTRLMIYMITCSLLTVATGVTLYIFDVGFGPSWLISTEGLVFSIGSFAGLVAYGAGQFVIGPTSGRIGVLGRQMVTAGGPPSELQLTQMATLQACAMHFGRLELVLMAISVIGMAGARLI